MPPLPLLQTFATIREHEAAHPPDPSAPGLAPGAGYAGQRRSRLAEAARHLAAGRDANGALWHGGERGAGYAAVRAYLTGLRSCPTKLLPCAALLGCGSFLGLQGSCARRGSDQPIGPDQPANAERRRPLARLWSLSPCPAAVVLLDRCAAAGYTPGMEALLAAACVALAAQQGGIPLEPAALAGQLDPQASAWALGTCMHAAAWCTARSSYGARAPACLRAPWAGIKRLQLCLSGHRPRGGRVSGSSCTSAASLLPGGLGAQLPAFLWHSAAGDP